MLNPIELFTNSLQYAERIELELPRAQLEAMPKAEWGRYQALIDRAIELGLSVTSWVDSINEVQHIVIMPREESES